MVWIEPVSWHYYIDLGFAIHEAAIPQENTNWRKVGYMAWRNVKNLNQILHFWNL